MRGRNKCMHAHFLKLNRYVKLVKSRNAYIRTHYINKLVLLFKYMHAYYPKCNRIVKPIPCINQMYCNRDVKLKSTSVRTYISHSPLKTAIVRNRHIICNTFNQTTRNELNEHG